MYIIDKVYTKHCRLLAITSDYDTILHNSDNITYTKLIILSINMNTDTNNI